jgi:hypothetical protein
VYIVELKYPGRVIENPDEQWCWEIWRQIDSLVGSLRTPLPEAALALTWFEEQSLLRRKTFLWVSHPIEWEKKQEIRAKVISELELDPLTRSGDEQIEFHTRIAVKRKVWKDNGLLPDYYHDQIIFVHAKTFLYSLDRIDRLLGVLKNTCGVPTAVADAQAAFNRSVPHLRDVRNSVAHYEDRSRGLDQTREPIDFKPVNNRLVQGPPNAEVLITESLIGSRFGCTMNDGRYGEVDVSPASLNAAATAIQSTINSFKWKGPPTHWPD